MAEKKRTRLRICELNPHLLCALCGGYLIDATTIVECLHSFCKTCILRYLETSNYCPICEVLIHKKRPWQNIRLDHTLQNAVYKLVPALFKREMQRRRDFYEKNPPPGGKETEQVHVAPERIIFSEDEKFSVSLEFSPNGRAVQVENEKSVATTPHHDKRFLLCPANVCIGHLKKFVRLKYTLPDCYQIDLFYSDEPLEDTYTLMDVAYIYSWRRENVLTLYYSFYQRPRKRRRVTASATASSQDNHTASSTRVIKAKTPANAAAAATTTTTTTSTVTIVEASDAGVVTEAEGTKTTVSVSLPTSTSLPLALSLPLPRPEPSKPASLGFDEDEDDDDDERPLIIVTDTPSASATPMEMDMAGEESGVTIISQSRTPGCKRSSGADGAEGATGKASSTVDSAFTKVPSSTTPSPGSITPSSSGSSSLSSSLCSAVSSANSPTTNCSSSTNADTVDATSSSTAQPSTSEESVRPLFQACPTQQVPSESTELSENTCPSISQRQAKPSIPADQSACPKQQTVTGQTPEGPLPVQPASPVEAVHHGLQPSAIPATVEATHNSRSAGTTQTQQPAQTARPADAAQPIQSPSGAESMETIKAPPPAETTCDIKRLLSADVSHTDGTKSAESSFPVKPCQPIDLAQSAEALQTESKALTEPSVPSQSVSSVSLPSESSPSVSCTETLRPTKCLLSNKEPARQKEIQRPKEHSHSSETASKTSCSDKSTEGQNGSVGFQNGNQGENSKKEARSISSTKGFPSEASSGSSSRSRSNSSSLGIFDRIYTVTSNCTASGIKSIFKTTAIVPATSASRRYSDVSGTSPVAGVGERRASTGDGETTAKRHGEKDKSKAAAQKHKTSPTWNNRSSLDALAHLAKNSVSSSLHGSKIVSQKVAGHGSESAKSSHSLSIDTGPCKTMDKRQTAKGDSVHSDKESSRSAAPSSSLAKISIGLSSSKSTPKEPVNVITTTGAKGAAAVAVKAVSGVKTKSLSGDRALLPSPASASKAETKTTNVVITGDLRVRLPKCPLSSERLAAAIDQLRQQPCDSSSMSSARKSPGNKSVVDSQPSGASSHSKGQPTSSPSKALPVSSHSKVQTISSGKPLPTSGMLSEDNKTAKMKTKPGAVDKQSSNSIASQKMATENQANSQNSSSKKENTSEHPEKRTTSVSSVAVTVTSPVSSGLSSTTGSRAGTLGASTEKRVEGPPSCSKTVGGVSGPGVRPPDGGQSAKNGDVVSTAGVKRPHSASSAAASTAGCVQPLPTISTTNSNARLLSGTKLVTTSADSKLEPTSASLASVRCSTDGPEAKKAKLSGSSQFSASTLVTPTILSSSMAAGCSVVHRSDGMNGSTSTISPVTCVSSTKTAYAGSRANSGAMTKVRPSGNHASSSKLLAPGQRVDSLLFRATNRMAAAVATSRPPTSNSQSAVAFMQKKVQSDRKVRSESVDSRMSFINKTFGGGRSSKETCINPTSNRAEISFSARHILSPLFYTGVSRVPPVTAASRKSSPATSMSSARSTAGADSPKSTSGACDLSRKSSSSDGGKEIKSIKEGCVGDSNLRVGMDTMKLDIPRLSTSSRDSVFASDPESSPTPSPKYSDINRNPIKLEPGSKLCRKDTWVSAENGGRRSTGSVGSPNSLGSGPGSPLETERSPARDARRPSDSELLLNQRWHGLHHHHHLLAIPHPRDPATAAAVAALYNGHFKVPPAAKYLSLAPEHVPRSASPDPMPLDYSTSSSSAK